MRSARASADPSRQTGAACAWAQAPNRLPWPSWTPAADRKPGDAAITACPVPSRPGAWPGRP